MRKINPAFLNMGVYLAVPLLIGTFLGYYLDGKFRTKPLFMVVGLILGTVSTFYNLWKLTKEVQDD